MRTSVRRLSRYGRLMAPGPLQLSFVRSYVDIDDLPYVNAEVAFVGRSNVGKSSLLNALAQRKNLAKTSKTPGATRLMNAFELAPENQLWVNPLVASEWDLKSGEYVRLGSPNGVVSNRIRVRVTERIGPDSVFMAHGFGHRSKRLRLTAGIGADDSTLMSNIKVDPIMGGTGMRANYVTFVKEQGREADS